MAQQLKDAGHPAAPGRINVLVFAGPGAGAEWMPARHFIEWLAEWGRDILGFAGRYAQSGSVHGAGVRAVVPRSSGASPTRILHDIRCLDFCSGTSIVQPQAWSQCLVKVREVIAMIEADGWRLVRTRGSHRHVRHSAKPGTVTIARKLSRDMPRGTLKSVLKQAGLQE